MSVDRGGIVAGIQPVIAALRANPAGVRRVRLTSAARNQRLRDIELLAADADIEVIHDQREHLDELAGLESHQDVVAELYGNTELHEGDLDPLLDSVPGDPLLLVLDGIQDPRNLGACLRSAEATGVCAVIIPKDRAARLTPAARKASAGASELVPIVRVTNLARTLRALKGRGIWLCGATEDAPEGFQARDLTGPLALVMGGEGKGLRRLTAETCDFLVRIPMAGAVESLNVSVATGVVLYEIQRQRTAR